MKLLSIFTSSKKAAPRPMRDSKDRYSQAVKIGREQFKKLVSKGLEVPIVLL